MCSVQSPRSRPLPRAAVAAAAAAAGKTRFGDDAGAKKENVCANVSGDEDAPNKPEVVEAVTPPPRAAAKGIAWAGGSSARDLAVAAGPAAAEGECSEEEEILLRVTPTPARANCADAGACSVHPGGGRGGAAAALAFATPAPAAPAFEPRARLASASAASWASSAPQAALGGSNSGAGPRRAGIGGYSPPKQVARLFAPEVAATLAPALGRVRSPDEDLPPCAATEDYATYRAFVAACKTGAQRGAPCGGGAQAQQGRRINGASSPSSGSDAGDNASNGSSSPEACDSPLSRSPASSTPRWGRGGADSLPTTCSRHGRRALTKLNLYQFWANLLLAHPQLEGVFDEFICEAVADASVGREQGAHAQQCMLSGGGGVRTDHGATWVIRFLYTACSRSTAGRDAFYAHFEHLAVRLHDEFGLEYGLEKLWRFHRAAATVSTTTAATSFDPDNAPDAGGDSAGDGQRPTLGAAPESVSSLCTSTRAAELVASLAERFAARPFDVATPSMAMAGHAHSHARAMAQVYAPQGHPMHMHSAHAQHVHQAHAAHAHAHAMQMNAAYGGAMAHKQQGVTAQRHFYVPGRGRVLSAGGRVPAHFWAAGMQAAGAMRLLSSAPAQLSPAAQHAAAQHAAQQQAANAHAQAYAQQHHAAALAHQHRAGAGGRVMPPAPTAAMQGVAEEAAASAGGGRLSAGGSSAMPYLPPHMSAQSVAMAAARANGGVPHAMPMYMPGTMGGSFLVPQYQHQHNSAHAQAAQVACPSGGAARR